jgi:phosphate transport system substrate-binding protein
MPLKADELAKDGLVQFPTLMGGVVPVVNLDGVAPGQLVLDGPTLAKIFLGEIKTWDDPAIQKLNPQAKLLADAIAIVHRSDGSGTTFIFTNYLSKVSTEWKDKVGFATSVNWPGDVGGKGNEGVANSVKQIPGAIGYVEMAYAKQNNMAWAQIQNKAKKWLDPSLEGAAAAADVSSLPDNMEVLITDSPNLNAYPISGFTWLLVYENQNDAAKADAIAQLTWWMIHEGQQYAGPLEYAPLKGAALKKAEALVKKVKGSGALVMK